MLTANARRFSFPRTRQIIKRSLHQGNLGPIFRPQVIWSQMSTKIMK
jgi:hypothetical protein